MKTTALVAALALAAGTAFAQAPNDSAKGTGATSSSTASDQKSTTKKVAKKKTKAKKSTQSMGAGPANIETDLGAGARPTNKVA